MEVKRVLSVVHQKLYVAVRALTSSLTRCAGGLEVVVLAPHHIVITVD